MMSFSSDLKKEISTKIDKAEPCRIAELSGIFSLNARLYNDSNVPYIRIKTDVTYMMDIVLKMIRLLFDFTKAEIMIDEEESENASVTIIGDKAVGQVLMKLKLTEDDTRLSSDDIIIQKECCKKAFLRGLFLARGSVNDPNKSYQMEIVVSNEYRVDQLIHILNSFGLEPKSFKRRSHFVVYVKDSNSISEIIGILGASNAFMEFENIRIYKDLRNSINREVNCETANISKITEAAAKQINDIKIIEEKKGLKSLSAPLLELATIRLENPDLSLKELGDMVSPPIGKSGVNHRLRRISEIADSLR